MRKYFSSIVVQKFLWMTFFLLVYVLGSKLSLPFLDTDVAMARAGISQDSGLASALLGGNLRSMSFLSIGLSPWMSAMLIWQMFAVSKRLVLGKLPEQVQSRRQLYLTLVIAVIQSLALVLNLPFKAGVDSSLVIFLNCLLLVAGTFFLIWLADLNASMGLGGSIMIIMVSMISYIPQDIWSSVQVLKISYVWLGILLVISLLFLAVAVVFERAKYRIPVTKVQLHTRFEKFSYLDIKLNPAGGWPIMYAMTIVSIPQYFFLLLLVFMPGNQWLLQTILDLSIGSPLWFALYISTIFLLSIAFAFINISGDQIAESMQKSGEYISGVYPGKETRKYINGIVSKFALVGALYLVVFAGLPMLMILWDMRYLKLSMLPGIFAIFIGMVFTLKDEVDALTLNDKYKSLL